MDDMTFQQVGRERLHSLVAQDRPQFADDPFEPDSAYTVVCFGVRESTSFADRIGPNERSAVAGYRRHRHPSSVSSRTNSTAIQHFEFRDEFLAQPAKRKSVRVCRRTSCGVKGTFDGMPFLQRSVSPMRVGIQRNLPRSMQPNAGRNRTSCGKCASPPRDVAITVRRSDISPMNIMRPRLSSFGIVLQRLNLGHISTNRAM